MTDPLTVRGPVWVFGDGMNTDAMYPGFAMKMEPAEAARHVFYEVRPGWTDEVQPGDIVIAGANFGVGSSRPVAALFRHLGVACLVAEEFNSLFFRGAINDGMPALPVPGVTAAFSDGDVGVFDLATGAWSNEATGASGQAAGLPGQLLELIRSGGIMKRLAEQGYLPEPAASAVLGRA